MGNTSPDNITYPDAVDKVGAIQGHLAVMAASTQTALTDQRTEFTEELDDFFTLPVPVTVSGPANQLIGATSFAPVPSMSAVTIDFKRQAYVLIGLNAWLVANVGSEVRGGVRVGGATTIEPNDPAWGQVLFANHTGAATHSAGMTKVVLCNAGINTFTAVAYAAGTAAFNYSSLQVTPLRWRREVA